MYIIAELHPMYGAFKQIQTDNYPFKHAFTAYLLSISRLGMERKLPVDQLVGFLEDSLIEGRLPDIPHGETPIKFKFTIDQPLVEQYFDSTFGYQEKPLTHKRSILLLIRMTLRLSEVYGTSLARLTARIERLRRETMEADVTACEVPESNPEPTPSTTKPVKQVRGKRVKISPERLSVDNSVEKVDNSVETVDNQPKPSEEPSVTSSNMLERLERLTKEGEKLLNKEEDSPIVETNPALSDFFG